MTPTRHRIAACVTLLWCLPLALADPPAGYYDSVDATNSTTLRVTLHAVIDDHTEFPYTSGSTDTWDILDKEMPWPIGHPKASQLPRSLRHDFRAEKNGSPFCCGRVPKGMFPNTRTIPVKEDEPVTEAAFSRSMFRFQRVWLWLRHEPNRLAA